VAQFAHHSNPKDVIIDESKPYAELWMGTHPKVPSKLIGNNNGDSLRDVIKSNPKKFLGEKIIKKFGKENELPFLFKVLSIEKVLSIQAHPDKELGLKLHLNDPKNYPDDNHKPEMAIAITSFEGFCGFKPLNEISNELIKIPEFFEIVGKETSENFINNIKLNVEPNSNDDISNKILLQSVFNKVMNANDDEILQKSNSLLEKCEKTPEIFNNDELPKLILRLNKQFPNDIGLFCGCLLLNHCKLNSGEAMFLEAKDPHAYISGDIIECMAASDNVVRAGFTPKFKDVKNLVEMLTYNYGDVEKQKMIPNFFERSIGDGESKLYDPPIEEFSVLQTTFSEKQGTRIFKPFEGPSILIVTKGEGLLISSDGIELKCETGFNFFIAPNVEIKLVTKDPNFTTYRAYVEA